MELNELTGKVIGCAIEVHKALGPGLLESTYEQCLAYELSLANLRCELQKALPIRYKDCGFRLDLVIEDQLIVEIKSIEKLQKIHEAQLLTYLKLTNLRIGLLINFNELLLKDGIKRLVR